MDVRVGYERWYLALIGYSSVVIFFGGFVGLFLLRAPDWFWSSWGYVLFAAVPTIGAISGLGNAYLFFYSPRPAELLVDRERKCLRLTDVKSHKTLVIRPVGAKVWEFGIIVLKAGMWAGVSLHFSVMDDLVEVFEFIEGRKPDPARGAGYHIKLRD